MNFRLNLTRQQMLKRRAAPGAGPAVTPTHPLLLLLLVARGMDMLARVLMQQQQQRVGVRRVAAVG
jgi:hypothetical protein